MTPYSKVQTKMLLDIQQRNVTCGHLYIWGGASVTAWQLDGYRPTSVQGVHMHTQHA